MENTNIFEPVEVLGVPGIFTNGRVSSSSLPKGLFAYDLREGRGGRAETVEPYVSVNHCGTVIVAQELDLGRKLYKKLTEKNGGLNFCCDHDSTSIEEFQGYIETVRMIITKMNNPQTSGGEKDG